MLANGQPSPLTRVLYRGLRELAQLPRRRRAPLRQRRSPAAPGFSYATTPAPDVTVTPLLPDMDRYNFSLGAGIPIGERVTLDAGYLRVETEGRRGRTGERVDRAQTAEQLNNGFYALNANIFSVSLKARF